ncbi:MAG TPA: NAD(P)/FAD-dependent oxidoreductase [Hypericibacter adhaerens]|uniref:phytoene desaturase family protein n=1 Tax=Hypericibacter adhaerens TaxID=2602016 RepID=UPI002BC13F2D|nr:NAD(P)/FAD-dependent oxidoreductase [Hypericibacter adhaerens]HWA46479.1 NAD(P)/FAD-dependent oxidoreductase [Hypericibacter adhaerens]
MTEAWDAIVIGAGHNGLAAAGYLAKAGRRVLVLERREVVGGAVLTEEFHPGFRNSAAAYVVSLLRPEVIRELELKKHGFETMRMGGSFGAFGDGRSLLLSGDEAADRAEVARFSNRDWDAMGRLGALLRKAGDLVRAEMLVEPPRLSGGGFADLLGGWRLGRGLKGLSPEERHRFLQLFLTPVGTILEKYFDSDAVKTMYAATATAGAFVALDEPGSAINLLHLGIGEVEGERGAWHLPKGGMGTVTQAMAKAAQSFGAEIRVKAPVATVLIENGRAIGVTLETGEAIRAKVLLSNADPKRTFLGLVGEARLPEAFAAGIRSYRMASGSFRVNFALSGVPEFASRPGAGIGPQHKAFIRMVRDYAAYDEAFRAAKRGELPADPILDAVIPTATDPSLAPEGCHILSILAQHYPYELANGRTWDSARAEAVEGILATAERYIPNLRKLVLGWRAYSPADLERVFGLTGGDVYHGQLDPGQIFSLRPHPDAAQYRTPIKALYLCGAGAHPGGGVSGAPGRNAAMRVLKDWRRL